MSKSDTAKMIVMYSMLRNVSQGLHDDLKELHKLTNGKYLVARDIAKVQCDLCTWTLKLPPVTCNPKNKRLIAANGHRLLSSSAAAHLPKPLKEEEFQNWSSQAAGATTSTPG